MNRNDHTEKLLGLIEKAVSPFHTIYACREELIQEEFEKLDFREEWNLMPGGKYFVNWHDSTLFAFTIGSDVKAEEGFRIAAAHGDFPGFRLKPNPEMKSDGYLQMNVETYGGANLMSWLDRPLSIAGRVSVRSEEVFHPEVRLVDFERPVLTIPNIAPHIERKINQGLEFNKQTQMLPISAMVDFTSGGYQLFLESLAGKLGVLPEDILDYELMVYNTDAGDEVGFRGEFISSPRLDDLTSVQALLEGIEGEQRSDGINMIAVFDHEEIGSRTKQGGGSDLMRMLLQRIYRSLGFSEEAFCRALEDSLMMSVDVAQGLHPNYSGKYDPTNKCILNSGFCIKEACSQSYATDCEAIGIVMQICDNEQIPYQKAVNRSDIPGGSTLGSIASSMLPVRTVDIGVPLLAMHSSREMMGKKDQDALVRFLQAYFRL